MGYCTQQDLIDRFGEREIVNISDKGSLATPHTGAVNAARVALAISDASTEIDGYLGACYDIPAIAALYAASKSVPRLVALACDIARYRLYDVITETDEVAERYKRAVKELQNICKIALFDSDGKLILVASSSGTPSVISSESDRLIPNVGCGSCPSSCDPDRGLG